MTPDKDTEGLPVVAYDVYFPDQQKGELVFDLDEMCEEMTNDENHVITKLADHAEATQTIASLRAELEQARADAERLNWAEERLCEYGSVWFLPCGEELRFVQVRRMGDCQNYPTATGLRAAIDAARQSEQEGGAA